jgi:hypothetical protein
MPSSASAFFAPWGCVPGNIRVARVSAGRRRVQGSRPWARVLAESEGWAGMRWIRSNLRGFARLALFALAVQAVVTFGHVHLDGLVGLAQETQQGMLQGARAAASQAIASPAKTSDQGRQGKADFDCPICALIQLASTSAPALAPPLPVPLIVGGTVLEAPETTGVEVSPVSAFQARGPPAV